MSEQTRPRFWLQVEADEPLHAGRRLAIICKDLGRRYGFKVTAVGEIAGDQAQATPSTAQAGPESKRQTD
jgi:hypothetical protein